MEEINSSSDYKGINNEGNSSKRKRLFLLLSLFSWLLLVISGWICFIVPDITIKSYKQLFFWCYQIIRTNSLIDPYPLFIHYIPFYMIAIITLLLITIAFIVYLYIIFIKKDANSLNGILGNASKFHFIPLLCVSALFIIGETLEEKKIPSIDFPFKGIHYVFNLLFTVLALISLIYITSKTKIDSPSYVAWTIKH